MECSAHITVQLLTHCEALGSFEVQDYQLWIIQTRVNCICQSNIIRLELFVYRMYRMGWLCLEVAGGSSNAPQVSGCFRLDYKQHHIQARKI